MTKTETINNIIDKAINETDNKNTKKKLAKLKIKRNLIATLTNKDINQGEYLEILRNICNVLYSDIEKKFPFSNIRTESLNFKLTNSLITYYNFYYATSIKSSSVKVYPISLDEKTARSVYQNELKRVIQEHLTTNESYEAIIQKRINEYQRKIADYKKIVRDDNLKPYYGDPKFMFERASYINECRKKLPFETKDLDSIINEMQEFYEKYPEVSTKQFSDKHPYFDKKYKDAFDKFEQHYLSILDYENSLMPKMTEIWKEYLTNPNNHNNASFKYIIHTFTRGLVPPDEMSKACCSLASERLLTTPFGNYGLIYDFTGESIETICAEDADSFPFDKEKFIDQNLELGCQVTSKNISFSISRLSMLILPADLEKTVVAANLADNGELLNYETNLIFPEIFLNSKARAIGVFYTDECLDITEIQEYAKKYNLPLIPLSLRALRNQAGLNTIATKIEPNKEVNNSRSY